MVVRKILETVLTAGSTSVSFTDSDIPYSLIRTYCSDDDLYPVSQTLTGNVLTLNYEAQSSDKYIAVEIVKQGLEIVDDLVSTDTDKALSAKQGKVIKDLIDTFSSPSVEQLSDVVIEDLQSDDILIYDAIEGKWINSALPSIPESISDLDDVTISSPTNGQVIAYNNGEWVNTEQSGSAGYSTTERIIGKWIDDSTLYEKTFTGLSTNTNGTSWVSVPGTEVINLNQIIDAEIYRTAGGGVLTKMPLGECQADTANSRLKVSVVSSTFNGTITHAVVRYTKTS